MSLLGHVHAVHVVLDFEIKIFFFPSVRTPQGRVSLNVLGPEIKERRWITVLHIYIYMLKGFLNTNKYYKCAKIYRDTYKEALDSPKFGSLLTVQSEVLGLIRAL